MKKLGVWCAIFANSLLTLALAIYTVVTMVLGTSAKPNTTNVLLALRVNDKFVTEQGTLKFENDQPDIIKKQGNDYIAVLAGSFKCTVTKKDKSKIVYDVTVYDYGSGDNSDPFNITKASDLFDLSKTEEGVTIYDNLDKSYALRADIDLSAYNWKPIGQRCGDYETQVSYDESTGKYTLNNDMTTRRECMFTGVFNGYNHTIKNMTMNIDRENFAEFVRAYYTVNNDQTKLTMSRLYVDAGFFGYTMDAQIFGVTFDNANVKMAPEILAGDFEVLIDDTKVMVKTAATTGEHTSEEVLAVQIAVNVGAVSGINVTSVVGADSAAVAVVNSTVEAGNACSSAGIGLVAGTIRYSQLNNIAIKDSTLLANAMQTRAGGVVGFVEHFYVVRNNNGTEITFDDLESDEAVSSITGVTMENVVVIGDMNGNSVTGGVAAIVYGGVIENVKATNISVRVNDASEASTAEEYRSSVAGAVANAYSITSNNGIECPTIIRDVSIVGSVNAFGKKIFHQAAGIVARSSAKVVDCSFKGSIKGAYAAGLVLYNQGTISYTDGFIGLAVDADFDVKVAAGGLAYENYGDITGASSKTMVNATIRSQVFVDVNGITKATGINDCDKAIDKLHSAGLAVVSVGGKISNFNVYAKLINAVNASGAVGTLGGDVTFASYVPTKIDGSNKYTTLAQTSKSAGELSNITVSTTIETVSATHIGSTKRAAGAVAVAASGAVIDNVSVSGGINQFDSAQLQQLSGGLMAGLVAEMRGTDIALTNSVTSLGIYVSNTNQIKDDKWFVVVAGIVGEIAQTGANDITVENVEVANASLVNDLGKKQNNSSSTKDFNSVSGAYGLVGQAAKDASATGKIVIKNVSISNTKIVSYLSASAGFGYVEDVEIDGAFTNIDTVTGYNVSGMFNIVKDSTITNSSASVNYLDVDVRGTSTQYVAGFAASVVGEVKFENCYAYVGNTGLVYSNNKVHAAGFAVQRDSSVAHYTNVVVNAVVSEEAQIPVLFSVSDANNASLKPSEIVANVYCFGKSVTGDADPITYLTRDVFTSDQSAFAGLTFGEEGVSNGIYWTMTDNGPALKHFVA